MRAFIKQDGSVEMCTIDHYIYSKRVFKMSMKAALKVMIRVKIYKKILVIETTKKALSNIDKKAIKKLYKEYDCFEFIGMVNNKSIEGIKEL